MSLCPKEGEVRVVGNFGKRGCGNYLFPPKEREGQVNNHAKARTNALSKQIQGEAASQPRS
jgi:hypothetical protein